MTDEDKRDRQMLEILNELRVALPGVQILFGFLLTVPFASRWEDVTPTQRTLFFATLLATTVSAICLIAPSATHRLRFGQGDRPFIIRAANHYLIAGLVFLAIAIILALALITDVLYDGWPVYVFPIVIAVVLAFLWFIRPLSRPRT